MRRRAGLWFGGVPPLGYQSHPSDKTTILVDEEAKAIVQIVFDKYLELGSARAVVKHLAQRGVKVPKRKTQRGGTRGGRLFTVQSVLTMLSNSTYLARRDRGDGVEIDCNWPPIIDTDLFERVQRKLTINSEMRPTGRQSVDHVFLLEGILRCGSCGSAMIRSVGTGRKRAYFYYRCSHKHKTANQGCTLRDIPAEAVERFVIDQVATYSVDADALRLAVGEANAGRDTALVAIESDLKKVESNFLQIQKQIAKLLDLVETGSKQDLSSLRDRLKARDAELASVKEQRAQLQNRRDALKREVLEAETVASSYARLPYLFEEARKQNAYKELHALLQAVIDVVEWREDPASPKKGDALIQLYPLPALLASSGPEPHPGVNRDADGSLSRQQWLRRRDSNSRPDG
jgi:ribosomal protein L34E/DNA-binding transcriptional MerR regulator